MTNASTGEHNQVLFNWKLSLPSGHYDLLKLLKVLAEKRIAIMVEVMDIIYQQEIRLLPHKGGQAELFLEPGDFFFPLEHLTSVLD